jgi:hypothetical protein
MQGMPVFYAAWIEHIGFYPKVEALKNGNFARNPG